ncbi:MAG: sdpI [Mucilaginibacter sp.]|nr:sdpI [Mucilaginibacter sp.]
MKKITLSDGAALVVWLLPIAYLLFIYADLPASVPMHYDIHGNVNRYGSKSEFAVFILIMQMVSLLVYLLLKFLPAIDPKKQVKYGESTFQKFALGLVIFLSALNIAITFSTIHHGFKPDKLVFSLVGLLFVFMGNMMHSIKPNYFAGIRTPWALENEDNWRATHRLAGKLWFAGGIVLTIATLLLPRETAAIVFMCGTFILAFVPYIYSYVYFKKHQLN